MKKKNFMYKMFATMAFVAVTAMAMVGCKKDPDPITPIDPTDDPEEPTQVSYFVINNDSLKIDAVMMSEMNAIFSEGKMNVTSFYLSNGSLFEGLCFLPEVDSISIQFADMFTFLFANQGCYASLVNLQNEEDEGDDMASGSITFVKLDADTWRIAINGTTASGKAVSTLYEGGVIDNNHPTGNGSYSVGDIKYDLSLGLMSGMNNGYYYTFTSSELESGVNVYCNKRINGDMVVTDKDGDQLADNEVNLNFFYYDENADESVEYEVSNGTLNCTRQGNNFTVSFSGTSQMGAISGSYTGSIVELGTGLYTKRLLDKAKKALKK